MPVEHRGEKRRAGARNAEQKYETLALGPNPKSHLLAFGRISPSVGRDPAPERRSKVVLQRLRLSLKILSTSLKQEYFLNQQEVNLLHATIVLGVARNTQACTRGTSG
jgi:hypothetical protein